ncbi:MAG: SdrD B-like domain-containing protein, partial [Caldilinea sp.]
FVDKNNTTHWEPARGALYTVPGAPSVAADASYIKNTFVYFQGPAIYSWTNGAWLRSQGAAGQNADFSSTPTAPDWPYSGHQVHDYELLSAPAPVEIGDRVWQDVNANGIQDPGEPGLANVLVKLTDSKGNTAQVTTDVTGYFLFSSDADPTPTDMRKDGSTSRIYGLDGRTAGEVNLLPAVSSPFTLSVALNQISLTQGGIQMYPTVENINTGRRPTSSGAADSDPRDSDGVAEIVNGADASVIQFSVSDAGTNDSSFDFGFTFLALPIGNKIWQDANNNGLLDGSEIGIANVAVELYTDANNDNIFTPGADKHILSTTSNSSGEYQFVSKIAGNLLVVITSTNFVSGGALYNREPSRSLGFTAVDGNTDRNSVSHGTRYGFLGSGGYVASNVVTISNRREPDTAVDGDDTSGNLTMDFGFIDVTSCTVGNGDVGGSIFMDSDFDGLVGVNEDLLPQDVRVFAYNAQNSVVMSATVGADGRYVLPGLYSSRPATETLRFEFTNLPDGFGSGPDASYGVAAGTAIAGSGTSIQFRSGASCSVNY